MFLTIPEASLLRVVSMPAVLRFWWKLSILGLGGRPLGAWDGEGTRGLIPRKECRYGCQSGLEAIDHADEVLDGAKASRA